MKTNIKELIILIIQILIFYLLPLTAGPADTMGLIVLLLILTFTLAIVLGIISNKKIKYIYPIIVSIVFIPSIFIYYNISASIYILWYLIDSLIGLLLGSIIHVLIKKLKKK